MIDDHFGISVVEYMAAGSIPIVLLAKKWTLYRKKLDSKPYFLIEILPIHIKGVAGSLVVLVNWLGVWAVSYTFNFLKSWSSFRKT